MNAYYLHTENMTVGYDGKPLIEHIEIGVRPGEILTLIGPNGSGKSTILKSMIRQLKLIAGTVVLDGQAMAHMKEGDIARRMSIVMTERIKAELMSCYDLVATGRYPYTGRLGLLSKEDHRIVREAIRTVHAGDFADRPFTEISDGQRQRLLLARAICQEPEVIVLDEPTSFLDIRHKLELLDILKNLVREKHVAVILSLHELDLAEKVSDRVVCVAENRIERCDTPENIFTDQYIARLYGIEKGSYNALFGCPELPAVQGEPKVMVIGGGGSGIPIYRQLQRRGIPFAAGILAENDLDYPVARALAAELISVPPFAPVDGAALDRARALMVRCAQAVCCLSAFGPQNEGNRRLRDEAEQKGLLTDVDALLREVAP